MLRQLFMQREQLTIIGVGIAAMFASHSINQQGFKANSKLPEIVCWFGYRHTHTPLHKHTYTHTAFTRQAIQVTKFYIWTLQVSRHKFVQFYKCQTLSESLKSINARRDSILG